MPISPKPAFELKIQCRMLGRCATYRLRSALNMMYAVPARASSPSNGSPICSAIQDGRRRTQQVARALGEQLAGAPVTEPHRHALGVLLVVEVLGVEADDRARSAAFLISSGSISGCGMSSIVQGLPCR